MGSHFETKLPSGAPPEGRESKEEESERGRERREEMKSLGEPKKSKEKASSRSRSKGARGR